MFSSNEHVMKSHKNLLNGKQSNGNLLSKIHFDWNQISEGFIRDIDIIISIISGDFVESMLQNGIIIKEIDKNYRNYL
jgi:hypothetical protein